MSDNSFFLQILATKTAESWLALLGGATYVWYKSGAGSRVGKAIEAGISTLISLALGPDISATTGYPPTFVYLAVSIFCFFILDVATSLASDKDEVLKMMKAFIHKWLGISKDNSTGGPK